MGDMFQLSACQAVCVCSESLLGLASVKSWKKPGVKTGPVRA